MRPLRLGTLVLLLTVALPAIPGVAPAAEHRTFTSAPAPAVVSAGSMPTFNVVDEGVSRKQSRKLDKMLDLDAKPRPIGGELTYADQQRFLFVPSKPALGDPGEDPGQGQPRAFELGKIRKLGALPNRAAKDLATDVLKDAGIRLKKGFGLAGGFKTNSTFFEVYAPDGTRKIREKLETQVSANLKLGGVPLVGPGASLSVGFGAHRKKGQRDVVSSLSAALYDVKKGPMVEVMDQPSAVQQCIHRMEQQGGKQGIILPSDVQASLVYYAPRLGSGIDRLMPHYQCMPTGAGPDGREFIFRPIFISAFISAPTVSVSASRSEFLTVFANATVTGGVPPYRYVWTSSTTTLDPATATAGPSISYDPRPRDQNETEVVMLWIADSLDQTATARVDVGSNVGTVPAPGPTGSGPIEVGTEWVGLSQGLGGSYYNANGFADTFAAAGYPVRFNYGDFAAWEEDFKRADAPGGGTDSTYIDNVDVTFYTGHAGDWGFTFPGEHDDPWLQWGEPRWGDGDLEWLGIAACGPLQEVDGAGRNVVERWGPAFDGLHAMLGYATISWDNYDEGRKWASNMLGTRFLWWSFAMTVVQSWVQMARDVQRDPDVRWAAMGPIGPGGVSNYFDNFHGRLPFGTGPDIRASQITGFWRIEGPAG